MRRFDGNLVTQDNRLNVYIVHLNCILVLLCYTLCSIELRKMQSPSASFATFKAMNLIARLGCVFIGVSKLIV